MNEPKNAKGKKGFLLYSPFTHKHFFRIYHYPPGWFDDPPVREERLTYTDYDLCAEDIKIEILCGNLELYETEDPEKSNRLDWSRRTLDPKNAIKASEVKKLLSKSPDCPES